MLLVLRGTVIDKLTQEIKNHHSETRRVIDPEIQQNILIDKLINVISKKKYILSNLNLLLFP